MRAGTLDRKVGIARGGIVRNAGGDDVEGYAEPIVVPASVRPAPGSERLASAENAATAPTAIRIRWAPQFADLSPADRIEYPVGSGRVLNIISAVEIGRRDMIEIAAIGRAER